MNPDRLDHYWIGPPGGDSSSAYCAGCGLPLEDVRYTPDAPRCPKPTTADEHAARLRSILAGHAPLTVEREDRDVFDQHADPSELDSPCGVIQVDDDDNVDNVQALARWMLDDDGDFDPGMYGVLELLRPLMLGEAFTALCDALEACPVHLCDAGICADDGDTCPPGDAARQRSIDPDDGDEMGFESCPQCDGPGVLLGCLGRRVHLRCRNCGWEYSIMGGPLRVVTS